MNKISKSPQRNSFQKDGYVKRCEEKGEEPNADYLDMFQKILEKENTKFDMPESRKNNMEFDLLSTDWILDKVRACETYAQNLYAAMCNNQFIKKEMWPILKDEKWSCSWRYAGGIIADMREEGDYIDWYCSGMRDYGDDDESLDTGYIERKYVPESHVTEEIKEDLDKLGWIVVKYKEEE